MMHRGLGSTALSALMLASATPVLAQTAEPVRRYEIAAGPLDAALTAFARQSGVQILYPAALVTGRRSPGLSGEHAPDAALAALLRQTGLAHRRSRPNVFVLYDPAAQAAIPEYQCRFRWTPNAIAFWDNRASQHYAASDYFPAVRRMERVTVIGYRPR